MSSPPSRRAERWRIWFGSMRQGADRPDPWRAVPKLALLLKNKSGTSYDRVGRKAAAPNMTVTYFAYGSNMAPEVIARLSPQHRYLGVARLTDHRPAFTRRSVKTGTGVADVVPASGQMVWGVLYKIGDDELAYPRLLRCSPIVRALQTLNSITCRCHGHSSLPNWDGPKVPVQVLCSFLVFYPLIAALTKRLNVGCLAAASRLSQSRSCCCAARWPE
jgi:hypothetical protein